jgi:hypothetical protein
MHRAVALGVIAGLAALAVLATEGGSTGLRPAKTDNLITRGKQLYGNYSCRGCHTSLDLVSGQRRTYGSATQRRSLPARSTRPGESKWLARTVEPRSASSARIVRRVARATSGL